MRTFIPTFIGLALAFAAFGAPHLRMPLELLTPLTTLPLALPAATPRVPSVLPQIASIQQQQMIQDRQVADLLAQISPR